MSRWARGKKSLRLPVNIFLCMVLVVGSLAGSGGRGAQAATVVKLPLNISANIRTKQVVKIAAGAKASLKVGKTAVTLKKAAKVKVLSEATASGKRWYQISFTYKGNKGTGYIPAAGAALRLGDGYGAYVSSKKKVTVKTGAGAKRANLVFKKKTVALKKATKVKVLKEYLVSGAKWYRVSFTYNKRKLKGYVPANKVKFVVKTQKVEPPQPPTPPLSGELEEMMAAQGFPEDYKVKLREMHQKYPQWRFMAFHTGLDWNTVINAETAIGTSPKNLLSRNKGAGWKSYETAAYNWVTDAHTIFDGTTWVAASRAAVEYYMDPRNFLNEAGIFQFEALEYQSLYQTREGVAKILENTPLGNASYAYLDDAGNQVTKTYMDTFVEAAAATGVSPYHLASRVKQEVVGAKGLSDSVTGKVPGYEGFYNFFNVGASDSKTGQAVLNGLKYASAGTTYLRPWNNPYKAILGGATFLGESYINRSNPKLAGVAPQTIGQVNTGQQNTLYLQKFNVTPYSTYNHQYMTNVEAPNAEAAKVAAGYKGTLDAHPLVFSIPIYLNMPQTASPIPDGGMNPNNLLRSLSVNGAGLVNDANAMDAGNGVALPEQYAGNAAMVGVGAKAASSLVLGVKVNCNGVEQDILQKDSYSVPISLNVGANNVTINVTAQNGAIRTYRFVVVRAAW